MPFDVKPRPEGDRVKAFELYMTAAANGKSMSLRAIASALGVSAMTIGRWREVDQWDQKVSKVLAEAATGAETTTNALKRRVRQGLLDGLSQLQSIALNASHDRDKIAAIKALADIAIRMEAITAAAVGPGGDSKQAIEFKDDLPEDTNPWQEITERPSKLDEIGDGAEPQPQLENLPEKSLSSSVADSEFPPEDEAMALLENLDLTSEAP